MRLFKGKFCRKPSLSYPIYEISQDVTYMKHAILSNQTHTGGKSAHACFLIIASVWEVGVSVLVRACMHPCVCACVPSGY